MAGKKPIKMQLPDKNTKRIATAARTKTGVTPTPKGVAPFAGLAASTTVSMPLTRSAQSIGGSGALFTQPMFFSPLHTPQNWQIASKRQEVYQWARFYYENEPKVAAGIDFYSQFPINGFKLECKSKKIQEYFDRLCDKLDLLRMLRLISHERFLIGDVFAFLEFDSPDTRGETDIPPDKWNHADGTISRIIVLNPDWVEVYTTPLADDPEIVMLPDDELKKIVQMKQPRSIYDRLPEQVKELVAAGRPIRLSNRAVSHIKHGGAPYGVYGESLLRRLFTVLAYKTKLMTANWIVAERLVLPVRVVKIGDEKRPAGEDDINDVQQQLGAVANDPNLTLVTHHAFDYEWYGACHSADTEILTPDGWKFFYDLLDDAIVATYNKECGQMQWQQIDKYHEYDFKSTDTLKMYNFNARGVDISVTPNHRMLVERNGQLCEIYSQEVKHGDKFLSTVDWAGRVPKSLPYKDGPLAHMALDDYLELAGYYLSEGGVKKERNKNLAIEKQIQACSVGQNRSSPIYDSMREVVSLAYPNFSEKEDDRYNDAYCHMTINSVEIARYLAEEFGDCSSTKKIPRWIRDLPKNKLQIVYDAMMAGDGDVRYDTTRPRYRYSTTSKSLADHFSEIALKLGYFTSTSRSKGSNDRCKDVYRIFWSEWKKETPFEVRKQHIFREDYEGKVYCVKVPNKWIITRRNGCITIQGNSGKIHNITNEVELVGKELLDGMMLNQALLNGEMAAYCHSEDTLTLTDSGYKRYDDITEEDKIACYNPETGNIEYHHYYEKFVYDYDGEMVNFNTDKIDICVTPNHRMWSAKRDNDEFSFVEAKDIKRRAKFLGAVNGFVGEDSTGISVNGEYYSMSDYCELAGFFVSEGSIARENRENRTKQITTLHVHQNADGKAREQIESLFDRMFKTGYNNNSSVSIYNPKLAQHFSEEFGLRAENKRLPIWLKNLDPVFLEIVINAMAQGDGHYRKESDRKNGRIAYYTSSEQLANDFAEIAFKSGYVTKIVKRGKLGLTGYKNFAGHPYKTNHQQYVVYASKGFKGRIPVLESKSKKYKNREITKKSYKGKVYCFSVPFGLFVTMRNGLTTIQGNSSAQVGVEMLIRRLESWRNELADWVEKNVFLTVAKMQGFIDEEATKQSGEKCYIYPKIKWDDLKLRDPSNRIQQAIQLNQNGIISNQTLLEMFDLDYDQEIQRLREEQIMAGPAGNIMGGGMGGGMPGGGMGGGMPGGDPMGGGMGGPMGDPMGGGGMGGAPGMSGAPMGGGIAGGGMGATAESSPQKVYKKGKAPKAKEPSPEEQMMYQPKTLQLTKPEAKTYRILNDINPPHQLFAQFKVQVPGESQPFALDFAYPDIGLNIEADGEKWHTSVEDKQSDNQRDVKLANMGWTVIRISESALNENADEVKRLLFDSIKEAAALRRKHGKSSTNKKGRYVQASYEELSSPGTISISKTEFLPEEQP